MKLSIQGKNLEISDWLQSYVERKIGKLDRYLPTLTEAHVELSVENTKSAQDSQVVQVTLRMDKDSTLLRAEERSADMTASIDSVLDKLYRQIVRYKGKRYRRRGGDQGEMPPVENLEEEPERAVVRVKRFKMNPMLVDEAIEQMELLGHDFFVFFDPDSNRINVVYRRRDGDYGLIDPELAYARSGSGAGRHLPRPALLLRGKTWQQRQLP